MTATALLTSPIRESRVDGSAHAFHRWVMNAMSSLSESARADLIRAIAEHADRSAFVTLFEYYAPKIKAQVMRFGIDASVADDVAQDALLAVWQRAAQFDPKRGSASAWIFTISTNARIDRLRRDKRFANSVPIEPEGPEFVIAALDETADDARMAEIVRTLPEEQQSLVFLSFYSDMPHAEISQKLGIPLGTVKSRIRLAMARLRKLLGETP